MKLQKILAIAAAVLLIALVTQVGLRHRAKPGPQMFATWRDNPENVEAAHKLADHIVVGQVVNIRPTELVTPLPGEPGGVDRIPVEVVTIKVEKRHKGEAPETIEVFHTGHSGAPSRAQRPPPPGPPPPKPEGGIERSQAPRPTWDEAHASTIIMHDDAPYKVGERYMLFVRKGPRLMVGGAPVETHALVAPQGRYGVSRENKLEPVTQRGFAGQLRGRALQEVEETIGRIPKGK